VKDYQFTCFGFGHGVGMSQISAWELAEHQRRSAREILQFFYPGVRIQSWR
jgi:SpoIID/LytB domain protein